MQDHPLQLFSHMQNSKTDVLKKNAQEHRTLSSKAGAENKDHHPD